MRWIQFALGVVLIVAPATGLGVYVFWTMYWMRYYHRFPSAPQLWSPLDFPIMGLGSLLIAVLSAAFGAWLIGKSRGEDGKPHSLLEGTNNWR